MLEHNKLSKGELIWFGVIFWSVVYIAVETPLSYTFHRPIKNWHAWVDLFLTSIFVADLIYVLKQRKKQKAKNPLKFKPTRSENIMLVFDFLSCIPVDIIINFFGFSSVFKIFRLLRLLRLVRIIKVFNIVGNLNIVPNFIKLQFGVVSSYVFIHWISCLWIIVNKFPLADSVTVYNKALYWAVTTITTIGYGDITPTNNYTRLFTMAIMLLGVGFYGIVIGNISRILAQTDRYQEKSKEKMQDIGIYMQHYNIPLKLQRSVFSYYNHLLTQRLSENDSKIISELPHSLQNELQTYMNIKLIKNIILFQGCSQNCLKAVANSLQQVYFSPGEMVIKSGEKGKEMYILGHGSVDVIVKNKENKKQVVATLNEGQYFGESALIEETTRNADIEATSYCDVYKLSKDDFLLIIEAYPELHANVSKKMNSMKKRKSDL
jgi:hypothetical protein